ncbi:hypothetical protein M527_15460 [Sphingobium indicum IP26]|uniref:Peptidase C1 n=1 Tax=Sphingobium indicum F2 TaxID=1450518 RepID=A0A8E0WPZ5_9SPHN|nr:C1 family peptidase [Sphingobium indicum]EPR17729.1 hypothetical protein M527_15460 [Sphingobium indicum IP26]KER35260.1 peptidase C1 [Sphingobium indicum F2]
MTSVVCKRDLRSIFGPVRDQGGRPTCVAFAASDAHAALRPGWDPLCCEYAYYHAQKRAGRSLSEPALLPKMIEALANDGQPAEHAWPYAASIPPGAAPWAPPLSTGKLYGRSGMMTSSAIEQIIETLNQDRPVILLLMLSTAFFAPGVYGVIDPAEGEDPEPARRHAVVACGHGEVNERPALLVRNSWGPKWGDGGCGWLTEAFLKPRLFAAATLLEDVDVPCHPIAA